MWTIVQSPIDDLRVVASEGRITAIEFSPFDDNADPGERRDDDPLLIAAREQLDSYFAGTLREFDLPLGAAGTDFQHRVWQELTRIPWGATASYGEIAQRLKLGPAASRAVGLANGRNPIPIVVPCHRVIGANGKLTGYAGGLDRKQFLLELESEGLF